MPTIKIDALASEIEKICTEYVKQVDKDTEKAVRAAGNATKDDLASYNSKRGMGKYGASWVNTVEGSPLVGYSATVHSKMAGLPHLIEFGHGGPQPAPPHPHMDKAYEAGRKVFMEKLGRTS